MDKQITQEQLRRIHKVLIEISKMVEMMHDISLDGLKKWTIKTLELSEDDLEQLK